MATELRLSGIEVLLAELARLAPDLTAEVTPIQHAIAEQTAETLRAAYPVVTGNLRASVRIQPEGSTSPARVFTRLVVGAPYAEYYEFGTARTGVHPTFVPAARRGREAFVNAAIARVQARGLVVRGAGL